MHPKIQKLLTDRPLITDGAWGTEMQARGLAIGDFPDAWNLTQPDKVIEVAQAYVSAGSDIILTNTFGANRIRLMEAGLADQTRQINQRGAALSKQAANNKALVFASIGPSGKLVAMDETNPDELQAAFEEQAQALTEGGADALVIETMSDLDEARLAVQAAKQTGLPVVGCMVYDSGKDKDRTMMGITVEQAAEGLAEAGADIVGANCGQGIEGFLPICERLHAATGEPVWIKGNAGLPELVDGKAVYKTLPEEFASFFAGLVEAGAGFIGGCCGTNPEFIRSLVLERDNVRQS